MDPMILICVSLVATMGYLTYKADIGMLVQGGLLLQLIHTLKGAQLYKSFAVLLIALQGAEMTRAAPLAQRMELLVWCALGVAVIARGLRLFHDWRRVA